MRSPSKLFRKQLTITAFLFAMLIGLFVSSFAPARAISFPVSPAVTVSGNTGFLELTSWSGGSCSYQNYFYVFYVDSTNLMIYMSTSTDGVTYTTATSIQTMTNIPGTGSSIVTSGYFAMSCSQNIALFAWVDNTRGAGKLEVNYLKCTLSAGAATCDSVVTGPKSSNGYTINLAAASSVTSIRWLNGHVIEGINNNGVGREFILDNVDYKNTTAISAACMDFGYTGTTYIAISQNSNTQMQFMYSSDFSTWSGATNINSAAFSGTNLYYANCGANGSGIGSGSDIFTIGNLVYVFFGSGHSGGNCALSQCWEYATISSAGTLTQYTVTSPNGLSAGQVIATTDGVSTIVLMRWARDSTGDYVFSTDTGSTWSSVSTFSSSGNGGVGSPFLTAPSVAPYYSTAQNAFIVVSSSISANFNVYATLFGVPSTTSTSGSGTLGSCPTKNTATTTLANNTVYFYEGSSPAQTIVQTLNTFLASNTLTGPTKNTLYLVLYIGVAGQSVSAANPLSSSSAASFSISQGDKNQQLSYSIPSGKGFIASANTPFAIAILGTDKMKINQSSLSGMFSVSGTIPPATITSLTTNAAKLYLCANFIFQSVFTSTTTVTSTASTTTTTGGTATTTITTTTTISTISSSLFATSSNWPIIFFLLVLPAGLFMAITRNIVGAIVGLIIGAVIGLMMGVIPAWIFTGLLICVVAVAFVARTRDN